MPAHATFSPPLATPAGAPPHGLQRLRWPAPALLSWLSAWLLTAGLRGLGASPWLSLATGMVCAGALAMAWPGLSTWRRMILGAGFPVAMLGSGLAQGVPAWAWLLPLGLLMLAYPLKAWRDAPLFPTPPDALHGLARLVPLPAGGEGAAMLDAGCGLGQGLQALHGEFPQAALRGTEWSWPLALAARWRCGFAQVRRGDLWADDWSGLRLVYLFQRPESMARAWAKACAEMAPGSWLVSLDFPVPGVAPAGVLRRDAAQPVWVYRIENRRPVAASSGSMPPPRRR
ncbi:class I SAM-dependent methyltransferase [Aquabacterium sp. OR-4]|uniref:class I SAM-dependent methyltransferase n=1 Tax=Aquabacterium sp. OR-4 TaxID=2978127 RepID=UPI0021B36147|nr:class I SAM-dependent methyltransferase [Aquabacterium sp. OR-4]MDT7836561.1 class I SAM-dependent methyltransferase [Aquabacterium sp. OR-4]